MPPAFSRGDRLIDEMKLNRDYIIPFVGLKLGGHNFDFQITDSFFDDIDYSIIHKGNVKVELLLEKKETMLIGDYKISGVVEMECSRCTDPVDVEIEGEYKLVYKFGTEPSDDESLIIVYPEEFELNIKENILELITVSLPALATHEEGDCNEEMISILSDYMMVSDDRNESDEVNQDETTNEGPIDPRWEELNKLKKRT